MDKNNSAIPENLVCPVCEGGLVRAGSSLLCENGHCYDVAKSGYVNLLPPGKGKNARTGDEKTMIRARADFLAKGYYDNISLKLADIVSDCLIHGDGFINKGKIFTADLGSGEGHHTLNFTRGLSALLPDKSCITIGFDASKYGAECGMKLSKSCGLSPRDGIGGTFGENPARVQLYFLPANIFYLPLCENSVDVCLSMFAPIPFGECARVLGENGILAAAFSGKNHLIEMRELIYDTVNDSEPYHPENSDSQFELLRKDNLCERITVAHEDIMNLFTMTPFYYRTTREGRERLAAQNELELTVDVNYFILKLKK